MMQYMNTKIINRNNIFLYVPVENKRRNTMKLKPQALVFQSSLRILQRPCLCQCWHVLRQIHKTALLEKSLTDQLHFHNFLSSWSKDDLVRFSQHWSNVLGEIWQSTLFENFKMVDEQILMTLYSAIKLFWAKESVEFCFAYGSKVISLNVSANLSCWWC